MKRRASSLSPSTAIFHSLPRTTNIKSWERKKKLPPLKESSNREGSHEQGAKLLIVSGGDGRRHPRRPSMFPIPTVPSNLVIRSGQFEEGAVIPNLFSPRVSRGGFSLISNSQISKKVESRSGLLKRKLDLDSWNQEDLFPAKKLKTKKAHRIRRQLRFGHSPSEIVDMEIDSPPKILKRNRYNIIVEGEHDVAVKKFKRGEVFGLEGCLISGNFKLDLNSSAIVSREILFLACVDRVEEIDQPKDQILTEDKTGRVIWRANIIDSHDKFDK